MNLKWLYGATALFALVSFVSLAAGNVALGIVALCFLVCVFCNRKSLRIPDRTYFTCIGMFMAAMLVSALGSGDIGKGLGVWGDFWFWRALPFFVVTFLVTEGTAAKKILFAAVVGLMLDASCVMGQSVSGDMRPAGFFGHPMTFAGFSCLYLPILLIAFLDKRVSGRWQWAGGVLFAFCLVALALNGTRGAWLAVAVVIVSLLGYYFFHCRKAAVLALCCLLVAGVGFSQCDRFASRAETITDSKYQSNTERLLMWQSAERMFLDHPVLGVGLGQYKENYQKKYILPKAKEREIEHAHNNFMQMAAENGAVGLAGFLVLISGFIGVSLWRFWKEKNPYALMMAASTLALVLQGLTEYNFGNSAVMKCFWLTEGCLLVLSRTWKDTQGFLGNGK